MSEETKVMNAAEFIEWEKSFVKSHDYGLREKAFEVFQTLSQEDKWTVHRKPVDEYFAAGEADVSRSSVKTIGKYSVVTTPYRTKEGAWNYTLAEVFAVATGKRVATVRRNYSSFWFLIVENHKLTGHDYLIAGSDYQGHSVFDLTNGEKMDYIPDDAYLGFGFCMSDAELLPDGVTLKVFGCYWACPYETRLYDFSVPLPDPSKGLTHLTEGLGLDDDGDTSLEVRPCGSLKWSQTVKRFRETLEFKDDIYTNKTLPLKGNVHRAELTGKNAVISDAVADYKEHLSRYDDDDDTLWEDVPYHTRTFHREGDRYVVSSEWKSPHLIERETKHEEWKKKDREQLELAKNTDPFYRIAKDIFKDDLNDRLIRYYPSMNKRWEGDENAFHFTLKVTQGCELDWGVESGPIVLKLKSESETRWRETELSRDEGVFRNTINAALASKGNE
jgi:hypothetical protein